METLAYVPSYRKTLRHARLKRKLMSFLHIPSSFLNEMQESFRKSSLSKVGERTEVSGNAQFCIILIPYEMSTGRDFHLK